MQFPLNFPDTEEKRKINIRVINKELNGPKIKDYLLSIPSCSVYRTNSNNSWEKIKVFGPLFVFKLPCKSFPVIFILNTKFSIVQKPPNTTLVQKNNFLIEMDPNCVDFTVKDSILFIKFKEKNEQFSISTNSDEDAMKLLAALKPSHRSDPTYKHLLKQFA